MQLFAGAETMRRFSSILNDTWPKDMPPRNIQHRDSRAAVRRAGRAGKHLPKYLTSWGSAIRFTGQVGLPPRPTGTQKGRQNQR